MTRRRRTFSRRKIVTASLLAVLLTVGSGTIARAYEHTQHRISAARHTLERSMAREQQLHNALEAAQHTSESARASALAHRQAQRNEQASLEHVAALASVAAHDSDTAKASLRASTFQRLILGVTSGQAHTCLDAVQRAMGHLVSSDRAAVVSDLNAGASACSTTLADATGARFPYDFPDPFVLTVGDTYYAFSTNSGAGDVQVITSTDLVNWKFVGNALAGLPSWASPGATWAPSVLHLPATGTRPAVYVMYYTVRDTASGAECVSSAVAAAPAGPYYDRTSGPVVCEGEDGGSIDPSPFVAGDGSMWLLWKRERNLRPATLRIGQLSANGRGLTGASFDLLHADRAWERGVVEAPSMIQAGGAYYLFFSGGIWSDASYATGVARCATPIGPCSEQSAPVMTSTADVIGTGGATVFTDRDGATWLAYAAYSNPFIGWPYSRTLRFARVSIGGSGVVVTPM